MFYITIALYASENMVALIIQHQQTTSWNIYHVQHYMFVNTRACWFEVQGYSGADVI